MSSSLKTAFPGGENLWCEQSKSLVVALESDIGV